MNQRTGNVDPHDAWVGAEEAARLLGVKRETLYAYASRGLVRSAAQVGDGPSTTKGRGRSASPRAHVYHLADLERLRARSLARSGHAPVAAGALRWGEPVLQTRVGDIRPDGPYYRGRSAIALARAGATFEDVCALLWEKPFDLGSVGEARAREAIEDRALVRRGHALLGRSAAPFEGILVTATALAVNASSWAGAASEARLVRLLTASVGLARSASAARAALDANTVAKAILSALGGSTGRAAVAAMNEALVLSADHELNASTFAARVTAGAGASLPATVLAALATASGPLHGAATTRVEALVREVARPERAADVVGGWLARGESVPGYGHPLYPDGDPRGQRLLEVTEGLGRTRSAVRVLHAVTSTMALARRERPTIDVGLVALAAGLGLGPGAPLAIFATGRIAGWLAHALEQRAAGFMLRPRALYDGSREV